MKKTSKDLLITGIKLTLGFFIFALGTVLIINCKIGVAPWDVLHQGIAKVFSIGVGRANIYTGIIIVILDVVLGQDIGWATIFNMLGIGSFIDLLMFNNLLPSFVHLAFLPKLPIIFLGICLQGFGTYLYISTGFGAGPRDGFMVALTRKSKKPFGLVKSVVEVLAVGTGFLLGGNFGIGTLIMAFLAGPIWQFMYDMMGFNISAVQHRFIKDDIRFIKSKLEKNKTP